tara:strand:+ start:28635 stop:29918 length:1284 start_codon:yes stop_codon:yes gene_type:complete
MKVSLVWFRRDLRLADNTALNAALKSGNNVLPLFIFDDEILEELPKNDARLSFIYDQLKAIHTKLRKNNSSILVVRGNVEEVFKKLIDSYSIESVYTNKDYEPYAIGRDEKIKALLAENNISFHSYKDQVIHEENEVLKKDGSPYTVFTPYKNKWLSVYQAQSQTASITYEKFHTKNYPFPDRESLGIVESEIKVQDFSLNSVSTYEQTRNFPELDSGSYLSPHLRFGTVSIRQVMAQLKPNSAVFLSELIWREFFMQILFHFPKVVTHNFRSNYDGIEWRNNEAEFDKWCKGETGYPMVDAGMKQLNQTGYMHNRVRMVTASFLCKHLLIDWRMGEAYFAQKLLDYELSSNNGNWQWSAGTGCDAAPYFRIFNPIEQLKKFDSTNAYVKKWLPNYGTSKYPKPMVDHKMARLRALETYKTGIEKHS